MDLKFAFKSACGWASNFPLFHKKRIIFKSVVGGRWRSHVLDLFTRDGAPSALPWTINFASYRQEISACIGGSKGGGARDVGSLLCSNSFIFMQFSVNFSV